MITALAATAASGLVAGRSMAQSTTTWRVQALYSPGNQIWDELEQFVARVKAQTGNRLSIQLLPAGGALPVGGTLDAVRAGVLDGHISDPSLWNGVEPGFATLGNFPGSFDNFEQLTEYFYDHGGMDLLRDLYAPRGIYPIGVATGGPEALVSNRPLPNIDALNGLKIRTSPGLAGQVFQRLGAGPVNIPFAEVFSALDKSIVDAADAGSLSFNDQIGMHARSKHVVLNSPHSLAIMDFSVNQGKWKALAPELKEVVSAATRDLMARILARVAGDDAKVLAQASTSGLQPVTWSKEDRIRFRKAAYEVWMDWAAKAPSAKKVIDHQVAHLRSIELP